jgi:hypothetical protein
MSVGGESDLRSDIFDTVVEALASIHYHFACVCSENPTLVSRIRRMTTYCGKSTTRTKISFSYRYVIAFQGQQAIGVVVGLAEATDLPKQKDYSLMKIH